MNLEDFIKPNFFVIGAQKSGTGWLWQMLKEHPGTDLPIIKEIHYFGGVENYRKGRNWYYSHFESLDVSKIIGESSTTYLYDYIPYWYNASRALETDTSLPSIPELITNELPEIKIIVILRDPVRRAVSAYKDWIRRGTISPYLGLTETAKRHPRTRILEYGYYARYLRLWKKFVEPERMLILIFEEDVVQSPETALRSVFSFLDLNTEFLPESLNKAVNKSWSWTRILLHYHGNRFVRKLLKSRIGRIFDRLDLFRSSYVKSRDIEFLRSIYLPQKDELEATIDRDLSCWNYGGP
jgi:hypothetical protein